MGERYDFGRNWSELATQFEKQHINQACADLARLVGNIEEQGFLDIGCGSGLHSVAALKLGAKMVHAVDYDPDCVATTKAVLSQFAPDGDWKVERADALDPATLPQETFDIVYSWGVYASYGRHVGCDPQRSGARRPAGRFCIAPYLKTPLCGAWTVEKKLCAQNNGSGR